MPHPSFFADVASIILEVIKFIESVYLMITFWSSFDVLCCPIHYKPKRISKTMLYDRYSLMMNPAFFRSSQKFG